MLLLLLSLAQPADAEPDRVAATLPDVGSTSLTDLVVFEDHDVAVVLSDGSLRIIDTETWEVDILYACDDPAGVTGYTDSSSGSLVVVVGCPSGGGVQALTVDADHNLELEDPQDLDLGTVIDVAAYGSQEIWVANDDQEVWPVDASSYSVGAATNLTQSGLYELEAVGNYVLALHGNRVSRIDTTTGSAVLSQEVLSGRTYVDMAVYGSSGVFLADNNQGGVLRYQLGSTGNEFEIILDDGEGLTGVEAVSIDVSDADDPWIAAADATQDVFFYTFDGSNLAIETPELSTLDLSGYGGVAFMEAIDGYLLAGTGDEELVVITEKPWVTVTSSAGASTLVDGDVVTLSFSSDIGGDWSLRLGGVDGDELDSGSFDAEEQASVELTIGDTYAEGRNRMVVVVDDGVLTGRAGATLNVDNPPPAVTGFEVGVARESLIVSFDGVDDVDLDHYELYITTEAFSAEEWASGGPAYVGNDDVDSPIEISGYDPGDAVSYTIEGLTNDVTYYLGVRAVDTNGTEGSMSDVLSAAPTDAVGAAGLAGETGGFGCATGRGPASAALALLGALALARRRRGLLGATLGATLLGLISTPAHAEDDGRIKGHRDDEGKVVIDRTGEIRFGGTTLSDTNIQQVYGSKGLMSLDLEMGVQAFRFFEFDAGLGLVRDTGYLIGVNTGLPTSEEGKLSLVPLSLSGTLRLDLFDGMPVVPYASAGLDYWLFRERLGSVDVTDLFNQDAVSGDKVGYHYAVGANILLDWVDPQHASLARARWGIHDSYVTVDVNWNRMLEEGGLGFAGRAISAGFKFDY